MSMLPTTGNVDNGDGDHQETELAVDGAEMGVDGGGQPQDGGADAAECGKQERPPENPRGSVAILRKASEPVAESVMQDDMAERQRYQHDAKCDVNPDGPRVSAGGRFKLDAGREHQEHGYSEAEVTDLEFGGCCHLVYAV